MGWDLLFDDEAAVKEIRKRLEATARRREVITYGKLVKGIEFRDDGINNGRPFQIKKWDDREIRLVTKALRPIGEASYRQHKFILTALVVWAPPRVGPGEGFFTLAASLGHRIPASYRQAFWEKQVKMAHDYFRNPTSP